MSMTGKQRFHQAVTKMTLANRRALASGQRNLTFDRAMIEALDRAYAAGLADGRKEVRYGKIKSA